MSLYHEQSVSAYDIMLLEEATAFIKVMPKLAQKKLVKAMDYVRMGTIKKEYFKKLTGTDGIWEFRVADSDKWYRLFRAKGQGLEGGDRGLNCRFLRYQELL